MFPVLLCTWNFCTPVRRTLKSPEILVVVFKFVVPLTVKLLCAVVLPIMSKVPGICILLAHWTPVPVVSVSSSCLAEPSANLLTAISALGLTSALTIVPSLIFALLIASSLMSSVFINWAPSCNFI